MRTPESQLMKLVTDWLTAEGYFWVRMNTVSGKLERGGYVKQGVKGMADLMVWSVVACEGDLNWLELKSPRGKLTPEQSSFGEMVKSRGMGWAVCRSLEDVKSALGVK